MNQRSLARLGAFTASLLLALPVLAQERTPPASAAEMEAAYALSLEKRAAAILTELGLEDSAKSGRIHDLIIAQYRALRARDEAIEHPQKPAGSDTASAKVPQDSKALHDQFIANLSKDLNADQIEKVKDKMTYNKVKFTYDAYSQIVPDLTDAEKARILELLKQAREEAIDGGSASNKSATFQKYKDKINDYLGAQGHDVAKATQEWNKKQDQLQKEQKQREAAAGKPAETH
jgi:hypothetical protein